MTVLDPDLSYLDPGNGRRIAVRHRLAGAGLPTILFLPGYASDMDGAKAVAIDQFCAHRDIGCLRLDYSGTGSSPGDFADGTLARWLDEVVAAIDQFSDGPMIIAGSSMGGWLGLLAALHRPAQVAGLIGIAAAPDFTSWGFTPDDQAALKRNGKLERANRYAPEPSVTHAAFWHSGQALRLLDAPIELTIPIRLVHGDCDDDVPVGVALRLMARLRSAHVQLRVIKGGGHRLSEPHEIDVILGELAALVEHVRP